MEACLHIASLLGDRFGLIIYHENLLAFNRAIVRRYGMEDRVVGFGICGFDLPDLAAHHDEVVQNFVNEAQRLIKLGAEMIIPMGISQCPVQATRSTGGGRVRRAVPYGGVAGEPGLETEPRALAEIEDRRKIGRCIGSTMGWRNAGR
jgi:hypothetical protein